MATSLLVYKICKDVYNFCKFIEIVIIKNILNHNNETIFIYKYTLL
jgi:hypothetical protein